MIFLFLCLSILDLAGISIIGPYVAIIIEPQSLEGNLGKITNYLGLPNEREELLTALGFILVGLFLVKAISGILVNQSIVRFGARLQVSLRSSLMKAYQSMSYTQYTRKNSSEYVHHLHVLTGTAESVVISALRLLSDLIVIIAIIILFI